MQYKLGKNNTREVYYSEFHVENNLQVYICFVYYLPKRKTKNKF